MKASMEAVRAFRESLKQPLPDSPEDMLKSGETYLRDLAIFFELLASDLSAEGFRVDFGQKLHTLAKSFQDLLVDSKEKELTVAVSGDFASGKSTFINAFLEHRIVPEGSLNENAKFTLSFRQSIQRAISLKMADDSWREEKIKDFAAMREKLKELAVPTAKEKVAFAECRGSFSGLPEAINLVLLPALDSEQMKKAFVRQIASSADLLLIISHCTRPLSLSLSRNVQKIRGLHPKASVFIVNACDLLSEAELDKTRSYFSQRLQESLGSLPFYFVSALGAMENNLPMAGIKYDAAKFAAFKQDFLNSLNAKWPYLQFTKKLSQAELLLDNALKIFEEEKLALQEMDRTNMMRTKKEAEEILKEFSVIACENYLPLNEYVQKLLQNMKAILDRKLASCSAVTEFEAFYEKMPHYFKIFGDQFAKASLLFLKEQLQSNADKINQLQDFGWNYKNPALEERLTASILFKGGEFALCHEKVFKLFSHALNSRKADTGLEFSKSLSALSDFAQTLRETFLGMKYDTTEMGREFQELIALCFRKLMPRCRDDFAKLYAAQVEQQEEELTEWLDKWESEKNSAMQQDIDFERAKLQNLFKRYTDIFEEALSRLNLLELSLTGIQV